MNSSSKNNRAGAKGPSRPKKSKAPRPAANGRTFSAPVSSTKVLKTPVPGISGSPYSGDGKIRVQHREYIGEIAGSVAFASTSYAINPGVATVFPWLSTIAANYESYKFNKLSFEFETEKSSATAGSIQLAVDFDAADSAPSTKQQLMTFQNAVRSAPWCPCEYRAAGPDLLKFGVQRYLRSAALASNLDIKTYDVGNLFVGTSGCADTSTLGELYVTYDVELHTPQLGATSSASAGQKIVGNGTISKTAVYGVTPTTTGTGYFTASSNTLTCVVAGDYMISQDMTGTVLGGSSLAITGTATTSNLLVTTSEPYVNSTGFQGTGLFKTTATVGQTILVNWSGSTTLTASVTRITPYLASLA